MINECAICPCFNKMNNTMKVLVTTLTVIIFGVLYYFLIPQIMPGDSGFVILIFTPFLIGGLLFGLGLFGLAFGISKLCE
ncbi:hypothetical protein D7Z54_33490 [Salibacterium salarium]|uniref:Uncharacterized protein n=1 Tax=Salibacterium salarium TaxID=284579 RepID=A0A3R9P1Q6_9BACI|nr:hypothetical protein [Salibacterium salarium]RSL29012.1 hypothetical protein D7Z54_33490 [Salibacterium salarium]